MVRTLVPALEKHGKRVVTRFLNYLGNSSFALQLPPSKPPPVICSDSPPFLSAVWKLVRCYLDTALSRMKDSSSCYINSYLWSRYLQGTGCPTGNKSTFLFWEAWGGCWACIRHEQSLLTAYMSSISLQRWGQVALEKVMYKISKSCTLLYVAISTATQRQRPKGSVSGGNYSACAFMIQ